MVAIAILELIDVRKRFGKIVALDGLTLSIDRGDSLGLVGPNGAGKTTTIRISIGVLKRDSGIVKLFGEDPWEKPSVRKYVGVVHDKPAFPEGMKCGDWIFKVCEIYGLSRLDGRRALELVGLWEYRDRKIKALSAGMKQRLALAQAIVHNPELLLLDEPFTNLDPPSRVKFAELLMNVKRKRGLSIFITSHTLSDVLNLASSIAVIHRGKIVFRGTPRDIEKELRVSIVRIRCSKPQELAEELSSIHRLRAAKVVDEQTLVVEVDPQDKQRVLESILQASRSRGIEVFDIETRAPQIEELLRKLVGA